MSSRTHRPAGRHPLTPLAVFGALLMLASCAATPTGLGQDPIGPAGGQAIITNPNGGGPQVKLWGPPDSTNPEAPN